MRSLLIAALLTTAISPAIAQTGNPVDKAAVGPVKPNAKNGPEIGDFGFDMAGRDTAVKPGNDFFDYSNGTWYKNTTIPADRSSYGMFHVLQDRSLEQTRTILDAAAKQPGNKAGDFYSSFMDETAVNAKGVTPVKPWLNAIRATADRTALAIEMAKLQRQGIDAPFGMSIGQDDKAPDTYIPGFGQSGLGLPDRDYYLKDDAKLATIRTAYQAYLARMLTLAGEPDAEARAAAVFNFEKALAGVH